MAQTILLCLLDFLTATSLVRAHRNRGCRKTRQRKTALAVPEWFLAASLTLCRHPRQPLKQTSGEMRANSNAVAVAVAATTTTPISTCHSLSVVLAIIGIIGILVHTMTSTGALGQIFLAITQRPHKFGGVLVARGAEVSRAKAVIASYGAAKSALELEKLGAVLRTRLLLSQGAAATAHQVFGRGALYGAAHHIAAKVGLPACMAEVVGVFGHGIARCIIVQLAFDMDGFPLTHSQRQQRRGGRRG